MQIEFNAVLETAIGRFPINNTFPFLYIRHEAGGRADLYHDPNFGDYTYRLARQGDGSYLIDEVWGRY